jgi:hypothetical protein
MSSSRHMQCFRCLVYDATASNHSTPGIAIAAFDATHHYLQLLRAKAD